MVSWWWLIVAFVGGYAFVWIQFLLDYLYLEHEDKKAAEWDEG